MGLHYQKNRLLHYVVIQSILAFREQGETVLQIVNRMGISESTVYKVMREWEGFKSNEVKDEWRRRRQAGEFP